MSLILTSQLVFEEPGSGLQANLLARIGLSVLLFAAGFAALAQEDASGETEGGGDFKVIVHADNPTVELETDVIVKMFRKKIRRWDHGVPVVPVDLTSDSPIRKAFTRSVHNKSVTAIESFWQRMIFSGRESPPGQKTSEDEALAFVSANPGAIGYVSADLDLGDGAKEVKVTP